MSFSDSPHPKELDNLVLDMDGRNLWLSQGGVNIWRVHLSTAGSPVRSTQISETSSSSQSFFGSISTGFVQTLAVWSQELFVGTARAVFRLSKIEGARRYFGEINGGVWDYRSDFLKVVHPLNQPSCKF